MIQQLYYTVTTTADINYFTSPGLLLASDEDVKKSTVKRIVEAVAEAFEVEPMLIYTKSRQMRVKTARWCVWKIMRSRGYVLTACGELTGGHDHTTVRLAMEKIDQDIEQIEFVGAAWEKVKKYMAQ